LSLERENRDIKKYQNEVLKRKLVLLRNAEEVTDRWRKLHNEMLITCTLDQILLETSDQGMRDGQDM
jgi:hypothetical protein